MKNLDSYIKKILIIDCIIFLFCIVGAYQFSIKVNLPFQVTNSESHLVVSSTEIHQGKINDGDVITLVDGYNLRSREEVEILLDDKKIGETISVEVIADAKTKTEQFTLVPFYDTFYVIVATILGIIFFVVGIFVLLNCKERRTAITFHNAFIAIAMIILMTWGNYSILPYSLGLITRIGFHIGYAFAPALFIQFTFLFPYERKNNYSRILIYFYLLSFIEAILLSVFFIAFTKTASLEWMRIYISTFDISSVYFIAAIIFGLIIFIQSFRKTSLESDRKKIRWILLGFLFGPGSYIMFWVIPQRLTSHGLLPESIVLLLVALLPISFAIAIIKYRIMDIDIIFKRSAVYSIVIVTLLILYLLFIILITFLFTNLDIEIPTLIAAAMVAIFMNPVKSKAQKFVDRKFFRIQYNYRKALKTLTKELENINDIKSLSSKFINIICEFIPVKSIGFFAVPLSSSDLILINNKNFNFLGKPEVIVFLKEISQSEFLIYALPNITELGIEQNISTTYNLKEFEIDLLFVIRSSRNKIIGFLVLGEKKSEIFFTSEDVDLITNACSKAATTIERIKLQEELILEHLESERLDELSKLKSFFVSSVSHDLKTPLTSIRMFTEILKGSNNLSQERKSEYFDIIEGESNRLTRLIDNVLDYSKIERGIKEYYLKPVDINYSLRKVLEIMEYQIKIEKITINTSLYKSDLKVYADEDAIIEAIINLISNAIKFSNETKIINISTNKENNYAIINITDRGIGISQIDQENLFNPYYRNKNASSTKKGASLGLTIVKHIMDAHKGKIEVVSKLNKGSTFKLLFPIEGNNENNTNN